MERINQINLLRESNALLRSEANANKQRVAQLESELNKLSGDLDPLREKLMAAQAAVTARDAQLTQSQTEIQHWQERNQQILSKVRISGYLPSLIFTSDTVRSCGSRRVARVKSPT
jgi:nucleoprotein TPR